MYFHHSLGHPVRNARRNTTHVKNKKMAPRLKNNFGVFTLVIKSR